MISRAYCKALYQTHCKASTKASTQSDTSYSPPYQGGAGGRVFLSSQGGAGGRVFLSSHGGAGGRVRCGRVRFFLLLAFFFPLFLHATPRTDSLLNVFTDSPSRAHAQSFFNQLEAEEFLEEPMAFGADTPLDTLRLQVWYWAAEYMYDQQRYDEATIYAKKALPLYKLGDNRDGEADCLNLLAIAYLRLADYEQAADYAKRCYELDSRSGDDDRISSSLNTLAGIYMAGYQNQEAEQYILKGLQHAERANNPARKAILLGMASEVYHTLTKDSLALMYAEQGCAIEEQLGNTPRLMNRLSQKASALIGLHRYKEAEQVLQRVVPQLEQLGDLHSMAIACNKLGMTLCCQGHHREAVPYYRKAADLFSRMGDTYNEIHSHRGLYECLWTLNPDSAKLEMDLFDLLKDSLYRHSTAQSLARYHAEFERDELEADVAQVRRLSQYLLWGGVVLLLLLVLLFQVLWCRRERINRRNYELLSQRLDELMARPAVPAPAAEASNASAGTPFLQRTAEAIQKLLEKGAPSVEAVAAEVGMSPAQLRQLIKTQTDLTPKDYIQGVRMQKARQLLKEHPELNVSEIAYLCGYEDKSNFTRAFKRVVGMTPTQFQQQAD